ncbi:MAG: TIGR00730 family Rossman fold protein [Flammeovirgaceae bacterium]|nr:TIGR00730 family Rossman fold protein [Flammeovirgaceae bacterium]
MNICVFCGSASGNNPVYADAAKELASLLCEKNATLIYGGGNIGLMGILADEVMHGGGKVIGVIPDFLMSKEVGHSGISQLEVVASMHERKRRMADLADAFIALPGGWGTLDELAEILTCYFNSLISQMQTMVKDGFLHSKNLQELNVGETPKELLIQLGLISV